MKKSLAILLAMGLILGLVGCGSSGTANESPTTENSNEETAENTESPEPAAENNDEFTVGFCPMDLSNNFWAAIANSFEAAGKDAGIKTVIADGKSDSATQVSALENFISQGVDVIVVGPVDSSSLSGVIAEAKEAGIPVITHTTAYEDATCNMNVDELEMGTAIGQICGK